MVMAAPLPGRSLAARTGPEPAGDGCLTAMANPSKARECGATRPGDGAGTWMLFRSGSATRIDVGLHEPGEGGHSAKAAYVVKECDTAMQDAAERGRLAALEWIARRSGTAPPAYRVSFDLPGVRSGENVGGASGGLAFAVAVVRAVRAVAGGTGGAAGEAGRVVGGEAGGVGGAVAAAGELGSGLSGGPVRGVQGIEAKIEGALTCLPAGSRLLYPRANDPEISAGLREKLREGGIEAMAVESVDGALDRLFPSPAADPPARPGKTGPHEAPSLRPGAATPQRLAVVGLTGLIGAAGVVAAALLFAGYEPGEWRRLFDPKPKGGDATAEAGGTAGTDTGFEDGAGPAVRPPEGSEDAGPGAAPGTSAGVHAPPPREPGDATPGPDAGSHRASAGVSPEGGDAGGTPAFPGRMDSRLRGNDGAEIAGTSGEPPDKGFD